MSIEYVSKYYIFVLYFKLSIINVINCEFNHKHVINCEGQKPQFPYLNYNSKNNIL